MVFLFTILAFLYILAPFGRQQNTYNMVSLRSVVNRGFTANLSQHTSGTDTANRGSPPMESIIYVGMDVHKDTYSLCSFDAKRSLLFSQTQMKSTTGNVVRYLKKVSECE